MDPICVAFWKKFSVNSNTLKLFGSTSTPNVLTGSESVSVQLDELNNMPTRGALSSASGADPHVAQSLGTVPAVSSLESVNWNAPAVSVLNTSLSGTVIGALIVLDR
jgi:hypothetical protein